MNCINIWTTAIIMNIQNKIFYKKGFEKEFNP